MRKTIRQLREARGWTQLELANLLGITPATVYSWERDRNEPRASQFRRLAELFEVPMEQLELPQVEREAKLAA